MIFMQNREGDLISSIRNNILHIGHFHTAGNPGRHEIDDAQEIYYPAMMRAIAETSCDGYVGQEFNPRGDTLESLEVAYELCNV